MKNNIVKDKSFDFAIRIVKLHQYLCIEKKKSLSPNSSCDPKPVLVL